jgi:cyclic beta-1,2-glucan synthetase
MSSLGTILGFYQNHEAALGAVQELSRGRLSRCFALQKTPEGRVHVARNSVAIGRGALWGLLAGLVVAFLLLPILSLAPVFERLLPNQPPLLAVLLPMLTLGALCGAVFTTLVQSLWSRKLSRYFAPLVVRGESLVVVQTETWQMASAFETLRDVGNEPPTTFVLRASSTRTTAVGVARTEPLSPERLGEQARRVAATHRVARGGRGRTLLSRLGASQEVIASVSETLTQAAQLEQSVSISGEWLLDNAFLIQGQIKDVRKNLPRRYYNELPVLAEGALAGTPRSYGIAVDLIAHTDSRLDRANISNYLQAYQEVAPLTIGELWAIPLLLRLALIEQLRRLAEGVGARQTERERADFWANRLLFSARRDPDVMLSLLAELSRSEGQITPHFADRLRSQLQDEESALMPVQSWIERKLNAPLGEIMQGEQRRQAGDQLSIASTIGSLRALLDLDWREVFEDLSLVHRVLETDPAAVYPRMDFGTRDWYRGAVEEIARGSKLAELDVAHTAINLANESASQSGQSPHHAHLGYFLIDNGRERLERRSNARPRIRVLIQRAVTRYSALIYIGGIALTTLLILALFASALSRIAPALGAPHGLSTGVRLLLCALALLPASDIAVQIVDYLLTRLLPPRRLPKMSFESGIPDEARSLVVVPMLLSSPDGVREDVERLEVRYLANSQSNLRFALLSDYADASEKHRPDDGPLLELMQRALQELNERHGDGRFFLFHRERTWSEGKASGLVGNASAASWKNSTTSWWANTPTPPNSCALARPPIYRAFILLLRWMPTRNCRTTPRAP